jgi:hypothetical protein
MPNIAVQQKGVLKLMQPMQNLHLMHVSLIDPWCSRQLPTVATPADQFEQEREELLHAVDTCAVHKDEAHRLEWENRKRADEVRELQKVRK